MKKLIFVLLIALSFSSCAMNKEHYIVVQLQQNGYLLSSSNNTYVVANANKELICHYFLLPLSDEKIEVTSIQYDDSILELVSKEDGYITFSPLHTGYTKIRINTKRHSSATSLDIYLQ